MVLLGFVLAMAGCLLILSKHAEIGILLMVVGVSSVMLSAMAAFGSTKGVFGFLIFIGSYLFLIPASLEYKAYHGPSEAEDGKKTLRKAAFNRMCLFAALFACGALLGLVLFFMSLAD